VLTDRLIGYRDLKEHGFVNPDTGEPYSRKHLTDMMRSGTWPKAVQVSANRIAWWESALTQRFADLPAAHSIDGAPLHRGPGRPAGSKVVNGHLIPPSEEAARVAAVASGFRPEGGCDDPESGSWRGAQTPRP
jgi:hypothetical protein